MNQSLVDTNVLVVANETDDEVTPACRLAAIGQLLEIKSEGSLVVDFGREILAEYAKHCNYAGQPGVGDEFFRWAVENIALIESVELTSHPDRRYREFPDDADLVGFDWDDRVFVAVSLTSPSAPRIINAVDSDYSHHAQALGRHGIVVHELCSDILKPLAN